VNEGTPRDTGERGGRPEDESGGVGGRTNAQA